jgi:hypothetical protein
MIRWCVKRVDMWELTVVGLTSQLVEMSPSSGRIRVRLGQARVKHLWSTLAFTPNTLLLICSLHYSRMLRGFLPSISKVSGWQKYSNSLLCWARGPNCLVSGYFPLLLISMIGRFKKRGIDLIFSSANGRLSLREFRTLNPERRNWQWYKIWGVTNDLLSHLALTYSWQKVSLLQFSKSFEAAVRLLNF